MVQVKDLTELKIEDLWREVKGDDEDWWGDLKQETLRMVKRLLESAMEEELLECLRVGRYLRTELRRGYRNGYRHRNLLTELGLVESPTATASRELSSYTRPAPDGRRWPAFGNGRNSGAPASHEPLTV